MKDYGIDRHWMMSTLLFIPLYIPSKSRFDIKTLTLEGFIMISCRCSLLGVSKCHMIAACCCSCENVDTQLVIFLGENDDSPGHGMGVSSPVQSIRPTFW